MTPQQVASSIEGLIISANETYAGQIVRVQSKLYNDLVTILKFIETDADGNILQNAGNRAILRAGQNQFDKTIQSSGYQDAVENHLKVIPKIDDLNADYFESVSSAFKPNRIFIRQLQASAIETVNTSILQDGLASQIKAPLNQILSQNINSGGSFSGFLKQIETFVKGNDNLDGRLLSYSKGLLKDTLFQYSRSYQESVTADLGLEWYLFSGPVISGGKGSEGSRGWCLEKKGRFFHRSEILSWASEEWAGKRTGTTESSIFVFVGGYNCVDSLIPVSQIIVPPEDLARIQ